MSLATPSDTAAPRKGVLRRLTSVPGAVAFSLFWLALMVLCAIFANWLRPYDVTQMDLLARLSPPGTPGHWLGTDELGRDVLSRLIQSIRVSLIIAFGATLLSAFFGTTLGGQFDSALPMDLSIDLNHRLSFTSIDLSTSGSEALRSFRSPMSASRS